MWIRAQKRSSFSSQLPYAHHHFSLFSQPIRVPVLGRLSPDRWQGLPQNPELPNHICPSVRRDGAICTGHAHPVPLLFHTFQVSLGSLLAFFPLLLFYFEVEFPYPVPSLQLFSGWVLTPVSPSPHSLRRTLLACET